ncbi:MAG: beta-lactamase family protein, partial [Acidimicrobiia bacterium]|nr:beta-lactamase family protein [Acidimicrobiia bacterium]
MERGADAGLRGVASRHLGQDAIELIGVHHRNGGAGETATGHPSADDAACGLGDDHDVGVRGGRGAEQASGGDLVDGRGSAPRRDRAPGIGRGGGARAGTLGAMIDGTVAVGFEHVRATFERGFAERDELGAAVSVIVDGESVVDLWGGHRDVAGTAPWTDDTVVNVWS